MRFTKNITKTNELGVVNRADGSVISTFPGRKLNNPYAMNIVDLCPVGALTSKDFRFHKRVWFLESFVAVCNGCARGSNIIVDHHKEKYKDDLIYRYRPRFNEKVNGYFICDAGRLSYKKENSNRLYENHIEGLEASWDAVASEIGRFISVQNDTKAIISPSLSLEEMMAVKLTCEKYGLGLVVSAFGYEDKMFGDDFLKCNDLAINRNGAKKLGLVMDEREPSEVLKDTKNVILIGLKDIDLWVQESLALHVKTMVLSPFINKFSLKCHCEVAIASHTERSGSFKNKDGFLQFSRSGVVKNRQAPCVLQVFSKMLLWEDCDDSCIWDNGLRLKLEGIELNHFKNEPLKVEL